MSSSSSPPALVLWNSQLLLLGRYQGNPSSPGCSGDAEAATMARKKAQLINVKRNPVIG